MTDKIRRIREPIHDLIQFNMNDELEKTAWKVINSPVFQRLRRIKQLGFSELVYPGATHTRFLHSIGVFQTARNLMEVAKKKAGYPKSMARKEQSALMAALLHDIGHGPFSHAFETAIKRINQRKTNSYDFTDHEDTTETLIRTSDLTIILNKEMGHCFSDDVADILGNVGEKTFHNAIVSSQFDADRLDYMRRDRMMTGSQHSAIDFTWLLENLAIEEVPIEVDDDKPFKIPTFVLDYKAIRAAEAYVLGLFQLYPTIYFHKATRGAEKFFVEIFSRFIYLVKNNSVKKTGLANNHPFVKFAKNLTLENFRALDDIVMWNAFADLKHSKDPLLQNFSTRLVNRNLYKCIDILALVTNAIDPKRTNTKGKMEKIEKCCDKIYQKLLEWQKKSTKKNIIPEIIVDKAERLPYKTNQYLAKKINIRTSNGACIDLAKLSEVVQALNTYKLVRVYYAEANSRTETKIVNLIEGECK